MTESDRSILPPMRIPCRGGMRLGVRHSLTHLTLPFHPSLFTFHPSTSLVLNDRRQPRNVPRPKFDAGQTSATQPHELDAVSDSRL